MGEWSDAMEDGVLCKGCATPLGETSNGGYCPDCHPPKAERQATDAEQMAERLRTWPKA